MNYLMNQRIAEDNLIVVKVLNATLVEGIVVGQYGLWNRNEKGRKLIAFCARNKLMFTNPYFKVHKSIWYTLKAPGDQSRSYLGADIGSDNLVMIQCEF